MILLTPSLGANQHAVRRCPLVLLLGLAVLFSFPAATFSSGPEAPSARCAQNDTPDCSLHPLSEETVGQTEGPFISFIDVGQGDCILIECLDGPVVLVDGGPRSAGDIVVEYLVARGIREIDLVVSTHPHADHIGGLIEVFEHLHVHRVIDAGIPHTTQTFSDYLTAIESEKGCLYEVPEGQIVRLGQEATLSVLGPDEDLGSINDNSVVCRVDLPGASLLLTGDAGKTAEGALLERSADLDCDILKVAHHGSAGASSQEFLKAASPLYAVICVGADNPYGHPAPEVLERLEALGVTVYRTDRDGTVLFGPGVRHVTEPPHADPAPSAPAGEDPPPGKYVASQNSNRYHRPDCRYAKRIAQDNLIWFQSPQEAKEAGYEPCGVCRPPSPQ